MRDGLEFAEGCLLGVAISLLLWMIIFWVIL